MYWSSRKQSDSTAFSSTMAEIFALSETVRASRLFGFRAEEMGVEVSYPLKIKVDSSGARSFQRGVCVQSRVGGIFDFREAWVAEMRDQGSVDTEYVASEMNLADVFTKCMPTYKFKRMIQQIQNQAKGVSAEESFVSYLVSEYEE